MSVFHWNIHGPDGRLAGCWVYLLLCRDEEKIYIKVGLSAHPEKRFHALRNGCPVTPRSFCVIATPGKGMAKTLEHALHIQFEKWRVAGEWFSFSMADKSEFNDGLRAVLRDQSRPLWRMEMTKVSAKWLVDLASKRQNYFRMKFKKRGSAYRDFLKDSA
jgi:hypothetical protein